MYNAPAGGETVVTVSIGHCPILRVVSLYRASFAFHGLPRTGSWCLSLCFLFGLIRRKSRQEKGKWVKGFVCFHSGAAPLLPQCFCFVFLPCASCLTFEPCPATALWAITTRNWFAEGKRARIPWSEALEEPTTQNISILMQTGVAQQENTCKSLKLKTISEWERTVKVEDNEEKPQILFHALSPALRVITKFFWLGTTILARDSADGGAQQQITFLSPRKVLIYDDKTNTKAASALEEESRKAWEIQQQQ